LIFSRESEKQNKEKTKDSAQGAPISHQEINGCLTGFRSQSAACLKKPNLPPDVSFLMRYSLANMFGYRVLINGKNQYLLVMWSINFF